MKALFTTFNENFPITDSRNQFVLEFIDYFVDPPRYSRECIERGLTYSVPSRHALNSTVPTPSTRISRPSSRMCILGTIPYMSPRGTFIVQWSRAGDRFTVAPFTWCILWPELPRERHQACTPQRVIPFKGSGLNLRRTSTTSCTRTSIGKRNCLSPPSSVRLVTNAIRTSWRFLTWPMSEVSKAALSDSMVASWRHVS